MKKKNLCIFSITLTVSFLLTGCVPKVKKFTNDELKWFSSYNKNDTDIFISERNETDTIIFYKAVADSSTVRSFDQGFYNVNYLTVAYKLTTGSYHKSALMGDKKTLYDHNIFNISKTSSNEFGNLEIEFIGTIFNGHELQNIKKINEDVYYFDSKKATYSGMNIYKGINDYTFNTKTGIVKYTDIRNIKWQRR